ncbi:MAG: serine/threonine-protein kinase [Cyanobacteria bacterium J06623_4]
MKQLTAPLLNRYKLTKSLSNKAGRQTFLATDLQTSSAVVVKLVQLTQGVQWTDIKLFQREASILRALDHPAIPKYQDYFEVEIDGIPSFVLVQTHIDAISLEAAVESGQLFSEQAVIDIANQLLETLCYPHQQLPPVIHRDIKPSNILIESDTYQTSEQAANQACEKWTSRVYLVDFGAVQTVVSHNSGTITIVGSYGYVPLEQFSGRAVPASDLYSLGMTLLYLLTSSHPADLQQTDGQIAFDSPEIKSVTSPKLAIWLERMTHPYLNRRFDSAQIALTALNSKGDGYGYYHHLKPPESTIEIYRDRHRLKILTPSGSETDKFSPLCSFVLFAWFFSAVSLQIFLGAVLGLFAWIGLGIGIIMVRTLIQPPKLRKLFHDIIAIDREHGICKGVHTRDLKTDATSVKWQQASPFQDINLFSYNTGHRFNQISVNRKKNRQSGSVTIPVKLSIYANNEEYVIGEKSPSPAEVNWIEKEVSDFLGLPLRTITSTKNNLKDSMQRGLTKQAYHQPPKP